MSVEGEADAKVAIWHFYIQKESLTYVQNTLSKDIKVKHGLKPEQERTDEAELELVAFADVASPNVSVVSITVVFTDGPTITLFISGVPFAWGTQQSNLTPFRAVSSEVGIFSTLVWMPQMTSPSLQLCKPCQSPHPGIEIPDTSKTESLFLQERSKSLPAVLSPGLWKCWNWKYAAVNPSVHSGLSPQSPFLPFLLQISSPLMQIRQIEFKAESSSLGPWLPSTWSLNCKSWAFMQKSSWQNHDKQSKKQPHDRNFRNVYLCGMSRFTSLSFAPLSPKTIENQNLVSCIVVCTFSMWIHVLMCEYKQQQIGDFENHFKINETQIKVSVSKVKFQTSKNSFHFLLSKLCGAVVKTFAHWCLWSNILTNTEKLHTSLDWSTTTEK